MSHVKTMFVAAALLVGNSLAHAGWSDTWFDSSTSGGASSYKNQQRGFYSAGSYSGRLNTSTDPLISIAPPRVSAGCGGVDLFLGGMSMLDADYLVDKMQNMIQAAPAIAFDTAMKVMSKELSETMKSFEQIINELNGLQVSDCQFAKRLGAPIGNSIGQATGPYLAQLDAKVASVTGTTDSWYETAENQIAADNAVTQDIKQLVEDCPIQFKNIFKSGSLLANAATELGVGDHVDTMRGFLGDVLINASNTVNAPIIEPIAACPENNQASINDFVHGTAKKRVLTATGTACEDDSSNGLLELVHEKMDSIAQKIETKTALTPEEVSFVTKSPIPVYSILRDAIALGDKEMAIALSEEVVAYSYAFFLVDDLYRSATDMVNKTADIMNSSAANGPNCDRNVYAEAFGHFRLIKDDLYHYRINARESYLKKVQEQMSHIAFTKAQAERQASVLKTMGEDIVE